MSMNQKEELRTQNMIRFIEAARELIDQEGLESLSIRKIAEKAGFHNSTIYLYFRDMDHLVMLATLKHFTDYSRSLARLSRQNLPPLDNFLRYGPSSDTRFSEVPIFSTTFSSENTVTI